jgi:hypothetical protein
MAQYENNDKSATEAYAVTEQAGGDTPLDQAWRNKAPSGNLSDIAGDVQARELAENDSAREARRKIIAILEEDDAPQLAPQGQNTGRVRRKNTELTMEDLGGSIAGGLNDAVKSVGMELFQEGMMGTDNEAAQMAESLGGRSQAEPSWDWKAVKSVATLRGGNQVPVWMVENTSTGMQINKPFRIQAPAERIVSLLNVTGNANDPRVKQIQEDYDQYVHLTKQYRECKKLYESGNKNAANKGQQIAAKLRGVKQRLGI